MKLEDESRDPYCEFIVDGLGRIAGWLIEAAGDPECFVVVGFVCAVFLIVGLIFVGFGAAAGIGSGGNGFQGLGLK